MDTLHIYLLDAYAFIILLLIYYDNRRNRIKTYLDRIFVLLLITCMSLLIIDSLAWLVNGTNILFGIWLNYAMNILFYTVLFIPPMLWLAYVHYSIYQNTRSAKRIRILAFSLLSINFLLSVMSVFTKWYFFVDESNFYHRGALIAIPYLLSYSVLFSVFLLILKNREQIDKRYFRSLLIYPLPMLIGSIVQLFIFGISTVCLSTISLLIVYFNIQNTGLNSDYLTGVYNRRLLDSYVRERISLLKKRGSFFGILIDLNKFKRINDEFGHYIGDQALKDFADILRSCLRNDDLIARFGGDEFFIILNIEDKKILENIADRIKKDVDKFNQTSNRVYKLSYSIGYDVYPKSAGMSTREFIEHLDKLMYQDKMKSSNNA